MQGVYTNVDFHNIITSFPDIKLCYEKIQHNKVPFKYCMLIPFGIKCFVWFTRYKNENVCLVLEIFNKKITRVYRVGIHYDSSLCNDSGTILYGTIFMNYKYKLKMISVENIYYKNKIVKKTYEEKINMIYQLFKDERIRSKKVMIGFPIMQTTVKPIDDYKVQYCQVYNEGIIKIPIKVFEVKEKNKNMVFMVRTGKQNEIYNLFDKTTGDFIDVAFIPNCDISYKMNKLFKSEKNLCLDAYEESDDEEEVASEKEFLMECEFHEKFKKWVPLNVYDMPR